MSRDERPSEQEAVRTTIVGGRPPGSGKSVGPIPRGIEVLVKKAAVDPSFKQTLLDKRAKAADEIDLKLEPAEVAMLNAVPAAQLETIIANTEVADLSRAAFLGRAAAVMLAALGVSTMSACSQELPAPTGVRPDPPPPKPGPKPAPDEPVPPDKPATEGIRPDKPEPKPAPPKPDPDERTRGIRPDKPEPKPEPPKPDPAPPTRGIQPDVPPPTKGIRPDLAAPPPGLTAAEIKKRVDAMVGLLASPEQNVRVEAKQALLGMGPAALPALKQAKAPNANAQKDVNAIIEALAAKAKR